MPVYRPQMLTMFRYHHYGILWHDGAQMFPPSAQLKKIMGHINPMCKKCWVPILFMKMFYILSIIKRFHPKSCAKLLICPHFSSKIWILKSRRNIFSERLYCPLLPCHLLSPVSRMAVSLIVQEFFDEKNQKC